MKYLLNFQTGMTFDQLEDLLQTSCMYGYEIRLGGLTSTNAGPRKVITLAFENRRDRDAIKFELQSRARPDQAA